MDCLCCAEGGAGPATDEEFLGSVCNLTGADGVPAKFPAEPDRYVLYVIAGCPFAARPWAIQAIYGIPITVVKLFPASYDQGWFFSPVTDGEKELVANFSSAQYDASDPCHPGATHLSELYKKANPNFNGAISVPLLWDKKKDTAVSNSSLGLAKMMSSQMKSMATRNQDLDLFPSPDNDDLVKEIHTKITTAVYKINSTKDGDVHDKLVEDYYQTLRVMEEKIKSNKGGYLLGDRPTFADIVLWISLVRLDLAYQWRFGLGKYSIREDYPTLQEYLQRMMGIEGIKNTVLPRDIMALYFMTLKWTKNGNGRSLPLVPHSWMDKTMGLK